LFGPVRVTVIVTPFFDEPRASEMMSPL